MRYYIRLSYDGAPFCGWQIQPNGTSIQERLQHALSLVLGEEISVTGAGRTDAGVNAINYTAHFDTKEPHDLEPAYLVYKLNAILPYEITIHEIYPAKDEFHARFSATYREYKYFIHRKKDPFANRFSWHCRYDLDMSRMNDAAALLSGTKDFSCFEKKGGNNKTSLCTVSRAIWTGYRPSHVEVLGYPAEEGDYMVFTIGADRFLRNMVRAVVGSLVEVGRGRKDVDWIQSLLEGGVRSNAGESVPGHALFLNKVGY